MKRFANTESTYEQALRLTQSVTVSQRRWTRLIKPIGLTLRHHFDVSC
ncbi:MAG: hypothetical protein ACTS42_00160 [Candidatus Hodgkinia cicadicola]